MQIAALLIVALNTAYGASNTVRVAAAQAARRVVDFRLNAEDALQAVNKNLAELERIVQRAGEAECDALVLPEDTPGLLNWVGANDALAKEVLPKAVHRMIQRLGCAMLPSCDRVVSVPRKDVFPVWTRSFPVAKQPQTIGEHLRKKRLDSGLRQSQVAHKLVVSNRTLSLWECDRVYPTWDYHRRIIDYLNYDPFASCGLRDPYSNETAVVASLSPTTFGERIRMRRLELKMTVKQCAQKLKVTAKTLHGWEKHRHEPNRRIQNQVIEFLRQPLTERP